MSVLSPFFALLIVCIAFVSGYFLQKIVGFKVNVNRFETIDGLRGFLAVFVFIHHTSIWYMYLHTGIWDAPKSNLFTQFGHTGVALFFMISSFLFTNKLLNYNKEKFNWVSFFINRIFRISPLHFFVVLIIILIVGIESSWVIQTSIFSIAKSIFQWLSFGLVGLDDINNIDTSKINAGVLWSLTYEWRYYISLPFISLFLLKSKPSYVFAALSFTYIILMIYFNTFVQEHFLSFLGGIIAPFIIKYNKKVINFNHIGFTLITITSLVLITQFKSSADYLCKLFIVIAFTLIALGNNLFGLLKAKTLKFLGELSYSTYLLHGVILFVAINYVFGKEFIIQLTENQYCLIMYFITPIVIILSYITYQFIEKPCIKIGKKIAN